MYRPLITVLVLVILTQSYFARSTRIDAFERPVATSQKSPTDKQNQPPHDIEGIWTLVVKETAGQPVGFLPRPPLGLGTGMVSGVPYVWHFSRGKIAAGPDNDLFPLERFTYEFDSKNGHREIDLVYQGMDAEKTPIRMPSIYCLKDDWLFLCVGATERPATFTTSKKAPTSVTLYVFRRGKIN